MERRYLRGKQQGPIHEGAVVVVVDEVVRIAGLVAILWLVDDLHSDVVLGVVEVDDVHVKDQHGRAGNVLTWRKRPPPQEALLFQTTTAFGQTLGQWWHQCDDVDHIVEDVKS